MVMCGHDGLARRLAAELREVYRQQVVLVTPGGLPEQQAGEPPTVLILASRVLRRSGRLPDMEIAGTVPAPPHEVVSPESTEAVLRETGTASRAARRAAARPHNSRATCDTCPARRTVRR
ncbi:hypothetical protein [Streptomyces sp. bgisy126]|uniref:hypothetical protein n=1 Tax=unclassified Streptomyces TaxID=2593676 RepID=UPI003EB8B9D7